MKVKDMPLAVLDQPLPLLLIMQVFDLRPVLLLSLRTRYDLTIPILNYFLILIRVVLLFSHHVMRTVAFGCS